MDEKWLTTTKFAAELGITDRAVRGCIAKGKIPPGLTERRGQKLLFVKYPEAVVALHDSLDASHSHSGPMKLKLEEYIAKTGIGCTQSVQNHAYGINIPPSEQKPSESVKMSDFEAMPKDTAASQKVNLANITYSEAQRRKEAAKAVIAELDLKTKAGLLVQKAKVEQQLFDAGKELRDALLAIPDRITDEVMAQLDNRAKVFNIIYEAIAEELEKLADINKRFS